jgi:hypothetical protein
LWKGEPAFRFDPVQLLGVTRAESCEPSWIVFLERQPDSTFQLEEVAPEEAATLLQKDLHQEMPEASERQLLTIRALSQRHCCRLRYGGDPHAVARALRQSFVEREAPTPAFNDRGMHTPAASRFCPQILCAVFESPVCALMYF